MMKFAVVDPDSTNSTESFYLINNKLCPLSSEENNDENIIKVHFADSYAVALDYMENSERCALIYNGCFYPCSSISHFEQATPHSKAKIVLKFDSMNNSTSDKANVNESNRPECVEIEPNTEYILLVRTGKYKFSLDHY
jgi:hypothetical protein